MQPGKPAADSDLPQLKSLARALLAADVPDIAMLDQIAALAGEMAARGRERARQQLLDLVAKAAETTFDGAERDLRARLAECSLDELSGLGNLLDDAAAARTALARADGALMTARDNGDYAAMAPLALEADTHKKALAARCGEFAGRLGLSGSLIPQPGGAAGETPASEPQTQAEAVPDGAAAAANGTGDPGAPAEADGPTERRRIRDLIRQMRPATDEALSA